MPRRVTAARRKPEGTSRSRKESSYVSRILERAKKTTFKFEPQRKVLSPLEKGEVGAKRLRDAVNAVLAAKAGPPGKDA
jgi:hypothetical protein